MITTTRRTLALLAIVTGLIFAAGQSFGQMTLTGAGKATPGGAAGYVGPGDLLSNWSTWNGLRCFSTAYSGNVAYVQDPTDSTHTLLTCSPGGTINETVQSLATTCAVSCSVKILYDQSGNTNCSANACDMTATSNWPSFIINCIGSKPCMRFTRTAPSGLIASNNMTQAQPFTFSWVAKRSGDPTADQGVIGENGASTQTGFRNSANQVFLYAGTCCQTAAATDGSFHAVQTVVNGASSDLNVDGTVNTVDSVTSGGIASSPATGAQTANSVNGDVLETGIRNGAFSAGNSSAMSANQRTYWGF